MSALRVGMSFIDVPLGSPATGVNSLPTQEEVIGNVPYEIHHYVSLLEEVYQSAITTLCRSSLLKRGSRGLLCRRKGNFS